MARLQRVMKCRKDQGPCGKCSKEIKKGDPYQYWEFKMGPTVKRCMACPPSRSDLTRSAFLGQLYDLQDRLAGVEDSDDVENLVADIQSLGEEAQSSYDNMPEGLQQGDTGQLLENRASACEEWADTLEGLEHPDEEDFENHDAYQEAVDTWLDDVHNCEYPGDD